MTLVVGAASPAKRSWAEHFRPTSGVAIPLFAKRFLLAPPTALATTGNFTPRPSQ